MSIALILSGLVSDVNTSKTDQLSGVPAPEWFHLPEFISGATM
jgi:hypothetical protein